jgi:hypothetical protein
MTILTNLPVTLTCGTPATVTLDADQLITDFGIVDPYWSNSANWRQCKFVYGSDQASQKTKINFTITTGLLSLATNAYDGGWLCSGIFITDGLENQIVFQRSEFPTASEFDFASTGGYDPTPPSFLWDILFGACTTSGNGQLQSSSSSGYNNAAQFSTPMTGDFTFSLIHDASTAGLYSEFTMIGYRRTPIVSLSAGDPSGNVDTAINVDSAAGLYGRYFGSGNTAIDSLILPNTVNRTISKHALEIKRVGSVITGKVDGVILFTDSYSGTLYLMSMISQTSGSRLLAATLSQTTEWDLLFNSTATNGIGSLYNNAGAGTALWANMGRTTTEITGDFSFMGQINLTGAQHDAIWGYKKTPVLVANGNPNDAQDSGFYISSSIPTYGYQLWTGPANTAVQVAQENMNSNGIYAFEILRVGSSIVARINGTTVFTDTYSGSIYLGGNINYDTNSFFNMTTSTLVLY